MLNVPVGDDQSPMTPEILPAGDDRPSMNPETPPAWPRVAPCEWTLTPSPKGLCARTGNFIWEGSVEDFNARNRQ